MWVTCYACHGNGFTLIKKDNSNKNKEDNSQENCRVCDRYRITGENYEFYGQIWIEEDYEVSTPPSSPR